MSDLIDDFLGEEPKRHKPWGDDPVGGPGERGPKKADYDIGYGKPPPETRFKPGQSGNPGGRKKGSRGLRTVVNDTLNKKITVPIQGHLHTGTPLELTMKTLAMKAATGDAKGQKLLLDIVYQVFGVEDRGGERAGLSPQDQALFDALLADLEGEDDGRGSIEDPPGVDALYVDGDSEGAPASMSPTSDPAAEQDFDTQAEPDQEDSDE